MQNINIVKINMKRWSFWIYFLNNIDFWNARFVFVFLKIYCCILGVLCIINCCFQCVYRIRYIYLYIWTCVEQCRRSVDTFRMRCFLWFVWISVDLCGILGVLNAPPSSSPASMSNFPSRGKTYRWKLFLLILWDSMKKKEKLY